MLKPLKIKKVLKYKNEKKNKVKNYKTKKSMSPSFVLRLRERGERVTYVVGSDVAESACRTLVSMFACYDVYNELEVARDHGPWVG